MIFEEFIEKTRLRIFRLLFSKKKQTDFLQTVADLSEIGISPYNAVKHMKKVDPKNKINKVVCDSLIHNMDKGLPFELSTTAWFMKEVNMILAASAGSGDLKSGVAASISYLAKRSENVKFFFQQATYPGLLSFTSISTCITIRTQVLSDLDKHTKGKTLPYDLQRFMDLTDFYMYRWWILASVISTAFFAGRYILHNYTGPTRAKLDKMFLFNFYREKVAFTVAKSLSILLDNQIGLQKALNLLSEIGSHYQTTHIERMVTNLRKGRYTIGQILDTGLLNQEYLNKIELIGFSSALISSLATIAEDIFTSLMKLQRSLTFFFSFGLYGLAAYNIYVAFSGVMAFRNLITS